MVGDRVEPIGDDGVEPTGGDRAEPMGADRAGVLITVGDRAEPVVLELLRGFVGFRAFLARRGEASQDAWQAAGGCCLSHAYYLGTPRWRRHHLGRCYWCCSAWYGVLNEGTFHFVPCRATHITVGDRGCSLFLSSAANLF